MTALILPLARFQAALTVWLLRGVMRLLGALWSVASRLSMAAVVWAADLLYSDPDPSEVEDMHKRSRDRREAKD